MRNDDTKATAAAADAAELAAVTLTDDDRAELDALRRSMESGAIRQRLDQLDQIDAAGGADQ